MERMTSRNEDCVLVNGHALGCATVGEIVQMAERLAAYEDMDSKRLRELAEADKDGRIRIIPESQNETCGHCYNFEREPGTKHGTCEKRPHPRDRYGKIDRSKQFIVSQSTQSCRLYMSLRSEAERALQEMEGKKDGKT